MSLSYRKRIEAVFSGCVARTRKVPIVLHLISEQLGRNLDMCIVSIFRICFNSNRILSETASSL